MDATVARLREELCDVLDAVIPPGPVAVLDAPDHSNVGDHAILQGQLGALERIGRPVVHVSSLHTGHPDRIRPVVGNATLLLTGGGTFGDFWPSHQNYREAIVEQFRDRRVVQMPQSLAFDDQGVLDRAARLFSAHPDFVLLVRDHAGRELARSRFECDVRLAPDAALGMGPLERSEASQPVLVLARHDHERVADGSVVPGAVDWPRPIDGIERRLLRLGRRAAANRGDRPHAALRERLNRWSLAGLSERRMEHGERLLCRGEVVVADRLHAHILSLLLGIPHLVADTRSGKVHGFIDAFTGTSPLVAKVASVEAAHAAIVDGTARWNGTAWEGDLAAGEAP